MDLKQSVVKKNLLEQETKKRELGKQKLYLVQHCICPYLILCLWYFMDNVTHSVIKYTINQQVDIGLRCWNENSNLNAISDFSIRGKLMKHCCKSSTAQQEPATLLCSSGIKNLKAGLNTEMENTKFIHQIKPGSEEITVTYWSLLYFRCSPYSSLIVETPEPNATQTRYTNQVQLLAIKPFIFSHFITLQGWNNWKRSGCSCAFPPKAEMWQSFRLRLSWQLYNWWSQWTTNLSTN